MRDSSRPWMAGPAYRFAHAGYEGTFFTVRSRSTRAKLF
jgi:hypothetical protein